MKSSSQKKATKKTQIENKSILKYVSGEKFQMDEFLIREKRKQNKQVQTITGIPRPFLKWAGGKRQLLPQLGAYFPNNYKKYIEPFLGGGAVFFYLLPDRATLVDINGELVNCYKVIQDQVEPLIKSLQKHENEKEYYYTVRSLDRDPEKYKELSDVERASRNIFLNRTCFNGLYRVNSRGQFNVPFGKYKNPKFCDEENLRTVSKVLKNVEIIHGSFEKCLDFAKKGDFVYFDPPYQPISETANFTSYTKENFGIESQKKLYETFKYLDKRGCLLMLSNSYSDFILDLYEEFQIHTVQAARAINSDATKRGKIKEFLVLNY